MLSLARSYSKQNKFETAKQHYRKLLAVQKYVLGDGHVDIAVTTKVRREATMSGGFSGACDGDAEQPPSTSLALL